MFYFPRHFKETYTQKKKQHISFVDLFFFVDTPREVLVILKPLLEQFCLIGILEKFLSTPFHHLIQLHKVNLKKFFFQCWFSLSSINYLLYVFLFFVFFKNNYSLIVFMNNDNQSKRKPQLFRNGQKSLTSPLCSKKRHKNWANLVVHQRCLFKWSDDFPFNSQFLWFPFFKKKLKKHPHVFILLHVIYRKLDKLGTTRWLIATTNRISNELW